MAAKIVSILFLALVAQAYSVTLITLEEQNINYIANDMIGRSVTIPKFFLDSLLSCHVMFPNGITYEAYPNSNLPKETIHFLESVDIFRACSIGFRGIGVEDSGTYELLSMVQHQSDLSVSLTTQKFNMNFVESEVQFPTRK